MRLPTIKRILREDLKDAPDWIRGVIDPVNSFMEVVYGGFNRNLTFTENVAVIIKEMNYKTPSTYPSMENIEFANTLKTKAIGVQLLQIYETATYTPPSSAVFVPWVEENGMIIIYPITGLAASKTYTLRLVVI